jgi:hypothetical protein
MVSDPAVQKTFERAPVRHQDSRVRHRATREPVREDAGGHRHERADEHVPLQDTIVRSFTASITKTPAVSPAVAAACDAHVKVPSSKQRRETHAANAVVSTR